MPSRKADAGQEKQTQPEIADQRAERNSDHINQSGTVNCWRGKFCLVVANAYARTISGALFRNQGKC